jgi:hypothetical protein
MEFYGSSSEITCKTRKILLWSDVNPFEMAIKFTVNVKIFDRKRASKNQSFACPSMIRAEIAV